MKLVTTQTFWKTYKKTPCIYKILKILIIFHDIRATELWSKQTNSKANCTWVYTHSFESFSVLRTMHKKSTEYPRLSRLKTKFCDNPETGICPPKTFLTKGGRRTLHLENRSLFFAEQHVVAHTSEISCPDAPVTTSRVDNSERFVYLQFTPKTQLNPLTHNKRHTTHKSSIKLNGIKSNQFKSNQCLIIIIIILILIIIIIIITIIIIIVIQKL